MAKKYLAFISYRHAELDSAIAKQLHTLIEQYRVPKGLRKGNSKRLGIVFRDEEELPAASNLTAEIQTALDNTSYLIVICSERAIQSPWCAREIDYFLQHHDRSRVLAVLASGEPVDVFPRQLTMSPDGPDAPPIEPLALDVRAETTAASCKKLKKGILKLIAAIMECPYDALVMREQKRKTRRITAIAAGAMAILLGFTSMVLAKNQEIELANTQLEVKNTELNDANTALAEQKAAVQLRESQLLTQNALEDLENANYPGAIENALAALPESETDDRPYYAPAESVLMEAMGILQTESLNVELNTTTLEQVTDIAEYVISQDGTRIVTVDEFGTVFCFDTESGKQLWHQYAAPEGSSFSSANSHLLLCNGDQTLVRSGKKILSAFDLQTGTPLWSTQVDTLADDYLFYNAQRESLLLANYYTKDYFYTAYQLVEVSTATGEVLQTIPLSDNNTSYSFAFSSSYTDTLSRGGHFTADGSKFYGAFFDGERFMHCIIADLNQGSVQTIYQSDAPLDTSASVVRVFLRSDTCLDLICKDPDNNLMIRAMQINPQTGKLLWQQDIPCPDSYLESVTNAYALFIQPGTIIGCNDSVFLLDASNGQILCTKTTPGVITHMEFVSDTDFCISLQNGYYGIGWCRQDNDITLTTDTDWQIYASLSEHQTLRPWDGGIVQMSAEDGDFLLGLGNFASPGYVSLIPEEEANTIQVIRPVQPPCVLSRTPLTLPSEDLRSSSDCSIQQIGSRLLAGPFYTASDYSHVYCVLDADTKQFVDTIYTHDSYSQNELFWLPDSFNPLICNYSDGIYTLDRDGEKTQLYDPNADQEAVGEEDNWLSSYALFRSTSAHLSEGNVLMTAACNPRTLRIWRNGVFMTQTDIPEVLQVSPEESSSMTRMIKIGGNGWVIASLHEYNGTIPANKMAAYNPTQDLWTCLRDDAVFNDASAVSLAQSKSLMAGMDQDGALRIIDLQTGNTVIHFPTQLPSGSVLQMRFFLDDTCLAIKAAGGHLLIYEISSGTLLYRDQVTDTVYATLQIFEDLSNRRLYLNCGSRSGLCLELDSWTALAQADKLMYYDSRANQVYLSGTYSSNTPIVCGDVPNTMELVNLAKTMLAEKQ